MASYKINKHIKKPKIIISAVLISLLIFSTIFSYLNTAIDKSSALSGSQFNPGRIIDDAVFYNKNSMSADQIQAFLNSKVSKCDTNKANSGRENDSGPPYTCLKDYRQNTKNIAPESGLCNGYAGRSNESAAQIIYNVAQSCGINPQVLIVMLQKEQGLITDTWPWQIQYDKALGAFCPDTAPCDPQYKGFFYQMYYGAHRFKVYAANPNSFNYKAGRNNYILYHPDRNCGGSNVYIENQATASLYIYTPYQPNSATLAVGLGVEAPCGAYGNKNFWWFFNDWFGSTLATPFFQIQGSSKAYIQGVGNTYYYVPDPKILEAYGYKSRFHYIDQKPPTYISSLAFKGNLPYIARYEGIGVFIADNGTLHPFPSEQIYFAYGYKFGDEAKLPEWVKTSLPESSPVQQIARSVDAATIYNIEAGAKGAFCNWDSYTKLGLPVFSTRPYVALPTSYLNTLSNGPPVAMDGDLLTSTDSSLSGIWQANQLRPMDIEIANNSGAINCAVPRNSLDLLPKATEVKNLVKNSNNNLFILDKNKKLAISNNDLSKLQLNSGQFILVSNSMLARIPSVPFTSLVRVGNNISVYTYINGRRYGIFSDKDLYGLGYNFSQVLSVAQKTIDLTKNGGVVFHPNRIVRESNSKAVFLLDDNLQKFAFTSEEALFNYAKSWSDVLVLPPGALSGYKESVPISSTVKEHDTLYWIMSDGVKHRIPLELLDSSYGVKNKPAPSLPVSVLSQYPMNQPVDKLLRAYNDRGVYLIQNGKKKVFASEQAMYRSGFNWSNVRVVNPVVISEFPSDTPIF